jgi:hypothetical protein
MDAWLGQWAIRNFSFFRQRAFASQQDQRLGVASDTIREPDEVLTMLHGLCPERRFDCGSSTVPVLVSTRRNSNFMTKREKVNRAVLNFSGE